MLQTQRYLLIFMALLWAPSLIAAPGYTRGLLWKIERTGQTPNYVFGTMHSEDSRVLALPKPVQSVFDAADSYVMEAVLDTNAMQAMLGP